MPTDGFDFPSFAKRYEISSAARSGGSKIAAVVSRDGLGPMTFLSDATTLGLKTNGLLKDRTETTKVLSTADGELSLAGINTAVVAYGGESVPVADAVKTAAPDILVVTLGENGAAFMDTSGSDAEP